MAQRLEVPEQLTLAYKGADQRTAKAGTVYPKRFGLEGHIREFLNWAAAEPNANFMGFNAFLVSDIDLVGISLEKNQQKPEEVVLGDENLLFNLTGELLVNMGGEVKASKPARYQAGGDAVGITSPDLRRTLELEDRKRVILYEEGTNRPIGAADLGIRFLEPGNLEIVSGYMHGVRVKKIEGEPGDTKYQIEAGHLKFRSRDGRWKVGQVSGELVAPDLLLEEKYALAQGWVKNLVGRKGNRSKSTSQLTVSDITDVASSRTKLGNPGGVNSPDKPKAPPIPAPPIPIYNPQRPRKWERYIIDGVFGLAIIYLAGLGIRSCINSPSQTAKEKQAWSDARKALDEGEYDTALARAGEAQKNMRWYERAFYLVPGLDSNYEEFSDGVRFFRDRIKPGTDKRYAETEQALTKLKEACGEQAGEEYPKIKDTVKKLEEAVARLNSGTVPCAPTGVIQPAAPTVIYVDRPQPAPKPKSKKKPATGRLTIVGKTKPRQPAPSKKIEVPANLPPVEIPEEPDPDLVDQKAYAVDQPFRSQYKNQIAGMWQRFTDANPGIHGRVKIRYELESDGFASDCLVVYGKSEDSKYAGLMRDFADSLCNLVLEKGTKINAPEKVYNEKVKFADKRQK